MNKKLTVILTLFITSNGTLKAQTNADTNLIVKKDWDISFTKSSDWSVTSNTKDKVTLQQSAGNWKGDIISIEYVLGDSIIDNDAKFGWISFQYDIKNKKWMKMFPDESGNTDSIFYQPADTLAISSDGFPIFRGSHRWLTVVIPLSHSIFLKCNIGGSGMTGPLLLLAGTIKKNK